MSTRLRRAVTVVSAALLTTVGTVVVSPPAWAVTTIFVDGAGGGVDDAGCGNGPANACATIQFAIDKAGPDDTVSVAAGTYTESITIGSPITLHGTNAAIDGSVSVGDAGGAVTVDGFTISNASAPALVSVTDTVATDAVTISNNTFTSATVGAQTGVDLAANTSVTITGNTFTFGNGGGAAISLSAPGASDALNVTLGGNAGSVASPTRTIDESGAGTVTVTPTATPNTITPTGASLDVLLPTKVWTGKSAVGFTGTAHSGTHLPHARYDLRITGTSGVTASQITLEYLVGSTWLAVPLDGTASAGDAITGQFGPPAGFDFPAGQNDTGFRLFAAAGAPNGSLSVAVALDEVAQQAGNPVLNAVAADSPTVVVGTNHAPVAGDQSVSVPFNTATPITLSATDADPGDTLTYLPGPAPTQGDLSGTAPNLTYTPHPGASGPDSFTFTASDGIDTSTAATVSITIGANHAPVAGDQSVSVPFDTATPITLTATDADPGDTLTYAHSDPTQGDLSGTAPNLTYTPHQGAFGPDSFTFTASDGIDTSASATVSITIAANHAPVASNQAYSVRVGGVVGITLAATDPDGDALKAFAHGSPDKGTLTGADAALSYHAPSNFAGDAHFTYTATDSHGAQSNGTITIHITRTAATISSIKFSPVRPTSAQVPKAIVAVSSAGSVTGGIVTVSYNGLKRTAKVARGIATVTLTKLTGGTYRFAVAYGGTSTTWSKTASASLTVSKVHTTLVVSTSPTQLTTKSTGKLLVRVKAPGASINGRTITVSQGSRVMGTGIVRHRVATITLTRLHLGQHNWIVFYPGTPTATAASTPYVVRVALG